MFKAAVLATTFATTLALSARRADDGPCAEGDTMTLSAWLGESDECQNDPLIEDFELVVGECTAIEGGSLPLFVLGTYNATSEAYEAQIYMSDDKCEDNLVAEVTDFTGECKEQTASIGMVAVMETKVDGEFPCNPSVACEEMTVEGFMGTDCGESGGSSITGEKGTKVPTDGSCEKVSADNSSSTVYAKIELTGATGSAKIYLDEDCENPVATFEDFDSASEECLMDSTGKIASVQILKC
ncbi:hypothetical protein SARC_10920 [Sphaeroforma arctica JP610]|uniref:Uncharacterized protein n=1 Tax=Sphaeroforma arctica JP610 TaxID=667725 RepID=A0A0L0FIJ5_9EUKA|nr:hypothetical protein SARC_10920 [Sphaeroforma arctica JP610]KNC76589.1 hypothetical protein SARC_10920 [Sphaeroforma arctica JP610]|eukprot:XP_014150491.1 hypothetical protein SARC_10920 [Sphaeroforma arctica JP610]